MKFNIKERIKVSLTFTEEEVAQLINSVNYIEHEDALIGNDFDSAREVLYSLRKNLE